MAGRNLKREIVITANGKGAESVLTVLKKHMKDLHDQMEQLEKDGKANTKEYRELQKTYKQLDQQTKQQTFEFERYDKVMRNLSGSSVRQLRQALKALKKEMELYSSDDPHLDILRGKIKAVQDQINEATGAVKEHGNSWQDALKGMVAFAAGFEVLDTLKDKLQQVIEKTFEFGDAQASVKKVTGLNDMGIADLSNRLAKMDTRTTLTDLHNLAYEGGKLGIGEYGVQGLESYVRAANQIKVALGDDLGEDAMLPLAKMGEVMGLFNGTAESVEKGILQIGSAINELTQSSASSASAIVDFGQRTQGMAAYLKLSTADMLALGSAADAAGLSMETSGTSFSMFLSALQKSPGAIEKALKIEDGTINQLVNSGKTMDAILLILDKMKEAGNMHNLEDAFKALGSEGARMVGVLATMSQKVDMVRDHLDVSRTAFKEATSVTNEYNVQNETAAAIMERANNMWNNLFVNTEGVDNVKGMAQMWYDLSKAITQNSAVMASANMTFAILKTSMQAVITLLPVLISLLMTNGLLKAFSVLGPMVASFARAAVANFGLITSAIGGSTMAAGRLTIAWRTMSIAMKANVITLAISVVAELAYVIYDLATKTDEATGAMKGFDSSLDNVKKQANQAVGELDAYYKSITKAAEGTKVRNAAIKAFNDKFGSYLSNLITEKSTVQDLKKAYEEAASAIKAKMYLQMKEEDIQKQYAPRVGWTLDRLNEYGSVAGAGKGTDWLKAYAEDNQNKTKEAILADLAKQFGSKNAGKVQRQLNMGKTNLDFGGKYVTVDEYGNHVIKEEEGPTKQDQQLFRAMRYILQERGSRHAMGQIDKKYKPVQDDIDKFIASQTKVEEPETTTTNTETEAERKKRLAEERKRIAEQNKEWRQQLKEAQSDANAIIDKIKNYYERQILEVTEKANSLNLDEAQTEALTRPIRAKMNDALAVARKAISNVEQGWDTFKQTMQDDMIEVMGENGLNESQMLLDQIEKADLKALQEKIATLSKSLNRPESALMDQIWRNATKNAQANADAERKQREEIQKILLEHNYTGIVDNNTTQQMEKIGAFGLSAKQVQTLLGGDEAKAQKLLDDRATEIATLLKNAREHIVELYTTDVETEGGRNRLMEILFGKDWDQDNSQLKAIFDLYGSDLKAFYQELLKYSDEYTTAEKRRADELAKIYKFTWEQSAKARDFEIRQRRADYKSKGIHQFTDEYMEQLDAHEKAQKQNKDYENMARAEYKRKYGTDKKAEDPGKPEFTRAGVYGGSSYFESMSHDPEIDALKLKIELQQAYLEHIQASQHTQEQLEEQQNAVWQAQAEYTQFLINQMKERMDAMYALGQPIEDFGTAAGEAFATMTEDAEAGRDAFKAAIGDMIKAMMKQTVQMTEEYIKRRMMQKINDKLVSTEIKKSTKEQTKLEEQGADATSAITEAAGQAKVLLTSKVGDEVTKAVNQQTQETTATEQAAAVTDVQTEAAKTEANVGLGIAGGAAKTIGSLGWWGIPLIAVITALLNGLLGFAMGKVSSLFGGGNKSTDAKGPNTKLVSGMLTYDQGNIQTVIGDNGKVYNAVEGKIPDEGVNLLTQPTVASVNGRQSLIAEEGPELVIGRETTKAIMMRPDLLQQIKTLDAVHSGRGMRTYDRGNFSEVNAAMPDGNASGTVGGTVAGMAERDERMYALMAAILDRLNNPVAPEINMYGNNGLHKKIQQANQFMKGKG